MFIKLTSLPQRLSPLNIKELYLYGTNMGACNDKQKVGKDRQIENRFIIFLLFYSISLLILLINQKRLTLQ